MVNCKLTISLRKFNISVFLLSAFCVLVLSITKLKKIFLIKQEQLSETTISVDESNSPISYTLSYSIP